MKTAFFLFSFFLGISAFACDCPPLSNLDQSVIAQYSVVFKGKVDSVGNCSTKGFAKIYFTIEELYKGNCQQHVAVEFDCSSSCMMSFQKEEEWLMYTIYEKFDELSVHLCSHSRKKAKAGEVDLYQISSKRSFDEEQSWLLSNLGKQHFIPENKLQEDQRELKPHNDEPSDSGKLMLLAVGLVVMAGFIWFSRFKK